MQMKLYLRILYIHPSIVSVTYLVHTTMFIIVGVHLTAGLASHFWLVTGAFLILIVALLSPWVVSLDCYQLGTCSSKSLPRVDNFVGREEDIRNITRYLDFDHSTIQVVHIVGPPGFGKSTLAKKIGHIFLRKRVKVHYVDIRAVTDMDGLAERIMLSIIDSPKYKVTFYNLEEWISKQYSNTLLILDNCDEMFEASKEEFLHSIKKLTVLSSVKYLLTSQRWIADIGNFRLHQIYNLSSEAASQLLGKLAPSLTEDQKIQIAELTGNVPLALEVLGAIFNFPNAPTVEEVIKCLKEDPMDTLSPYELPEYSTVYVSINLAYSYLSPELKELCLNLSYFPGSFEKRSPSFIFDLLLGYGLPKFIHLFDHRDTQLDMLVRRSLLHVQSINYPEKRYHFHQLIRSFFLHIQDQKMVSLQQNFESRFQLYFGNILALLMEYRGGKVLELAVLDADKHNLQYMFNLFTTAKHVNYTLFSINKTVVAIKVNLLQLRFSLTELCNISQNMLIALESYTTDEEASEESFLEIYTQLLIQAAKLANIETTSAIEILSSRESKIEEGYKRDLVSAITYIQFHADLAQYYEENNEEEKSIQCHMHILEHVYNGECYPPCDYFGISVAYEKTGENTQAFHFRELAYKHQQSSLSHMQQAKLYLKLYNDYTLRNNPSKVDFFSNEIIEKVYVYLMETYNENEYSKEVYYDAVDFFRAKDMKEHMVHIQSKMKNFTILKCKNRSCGDHLVQSLFDARERQCYHLTIELSLILLNEGQLTLNDRAFVRGIIGLSYYHIGNYSESLAWLRRALQCYVKHPKNRQTACLYLLRSGDYFNIICYGYLVKDTMSQLSALIIKLVYCKRSNSQPEKMIETGVTEVKHSYIWMQFFNKFQYKIMNKISSVKWSMIQFNDSCMFSLVILLNFLLYSCLILIISFGGILIIANFMSAYCTERQIRCCFSCATFCIFLSIFSTIAMFVFVLGLDVLY